MALNIGVRESRYSSVVVTSPEVMPDTNVLSQLMDLHGRNVICQVFDCNPDGTIAMSLVNSSFRSETAAMHFLAMFNKSDILAINGWDEDFMYGQAYDDDDFGWRFTKSGFIHEVHDEIRGMHQYHARASNMALWHQDEARFARHRADNVLRVPNGIFKE
jgi:hypothetical protein